MRPDAGPERNPIDVFVHLVSAKRRTIPAAELRARFGESVEVLQRLGAFVAAAPLACIACAACDEDHATDVEYDLATRCFFCFCSVAGRVLVDGRRLETLHVEFDWLANRVSTALSVAPSPPRRVLVTDAAWWLGDAEIGKTRVSLALSIGVAGSTYIEALTLALAKRQPADVGILLTIGGEMPSIMAKAAGYHPIDLREVLRLGENGFTVDQTRLGAWVRGLLRRADRPVASKGGRPPMREGVLAIFRWRRGRAVPYRSKLSEAIAIIEEWSNYYPDTQAPGASTIRAHLPDLP